MPDILPEDVNVLVGDVGGTNARLAVITVKKDGSVSMGEVRRKRVADFDSLDAALAAVRDDLDGEGNILPNHAVFALAGQTGADEVALTNANWVVSASGIKSRFGFDSVTLVNDFAAQARAVPALTHDQFETLIDGPGIDGSPIVVLGPGTGLGQAYILPQGKGWRVIPAEGGHQSYSAVSPRERAVLAYLSQTQSHVSFETLVCGPGLDRIYRALCGIDGISPRLAGAGEIGPAAVAADDHVAVEAAEILAASLATFAGNAILATGARGGCVIAGGVAEALAPFLRAPAFASRLIAKGPMSKFFDSVPVRRTRDSLAGLTGAAFFAPPIMSEGL